MIKEDRPVSLAAVMNVVVNNIHIIDIINDLNALPSVAPSVSEDDIKLAVNLLKYDFERHRAREIVKTVISAFGLVMENN